MGELEYKIQFYSEWHTGSGLTSGSDLDALVIKDENNLPFIPGKTLKGLIKEACENYNQLTGNKFNKLINKYFGTESSLEGSPELSFNGQAHFTNAMISAELKNRILKGGKVENGTKITNHLFRAIASTAIGDNGVAKQHSLRRMETVIPLVLYAKVLFLEDDEIKPFIIESIGMIKRLGQNRHRGLGRCSFEVVKKGESL